MQLCGYNSMLLDVKQPKNKHTKLGRAVFDSEFFINMMRVFSEAFWVLRFPPIFHRFMVSVNK